jgi:hypothetical protein
MNHLFNETVFRKGLFIGFLCLFTFHWGYAKKVQRHPFHTSVSECVYNEKDQVWDLSIRLFQDDFEQVLSDYQSKKFQFQFANQPDALLESYVRKHIGFQVNKKLQTPYRWIGWETQGDAVWIYLEIPSQSDLSGVYFQNSLFCETFADQTNLLHIAKKELKRSYLFQKNQVVQQISW